MNSIAGERLASLDLTCGGLLPVTPEREDAPAVMEARPGLEAAWITRAELRDRVARMAARLETPAKSLVFLKVRNDLASLTAFLAARACGHAMALLDAKAPAEVIAGLTAAYGPELVVDGEDVARTAAGPAIAADLALLLSTSGTTGSAKFVRLSADAVATNARQIAKALHIGPADVGVGHLAFHYSYGLSVLTSHLAGGAAVLLLDDSIMAPTFWKSVAAAGGTHFPGVPFHYQALARFGLKRLAPASVTTFTQAGGALDLSLQRAIHAQAAERGARFYVMYGQTEAGPRITTLQSEDFAAKAGSVGQALEGGALSILGEAGEPLSAGQQGEVIYSGPNVMLGYAERREDLGKADEQGGRLVTGDLGYLDADGFLFLTGRSKRIAKPYGYRVSLDEIEQQVADLGPCAALDAGETIVVFHEGDGEGLEARLDGMAESYGLPAAVFVRRAVAELPRKASGKTDYGALKEQL